MEALSLASRVLRLCPCSLEPEKDLARTAPYLVQRLPPFTLAVGGRLLVFRSRSGERIRLDQHHLAPALALSLQPQQA